MNRLLPFLLLFVSWQPVVAQERTLLDEKFESGGFGALVFKGSEVANEFAVFAGARGGWIINHTVVLGGGGYGLANDISLSPGSTRDIDFGYGGLELEYINSWDRLVHFTVYVLIGGGGLSGPAIVEDESVFVLEPALNGELNVTRYFRLHLGGGYRWVTGVDNPDFESSDFSAFYGQITFKFGSF